MIKGNYSPIIDRLIEALEAAEQESFVHILQPGEEIRVKINNVVLDVVDGDLVMKGA